MIKRAFALVAAILFSSTLVLSQNLAEFARKEKERREALKGKAAVVVTNADLAKVKIKPAVAVPASQTEPPVEEGELPEDPEEKAKLTPREPPAGSLARAQNELEAARRQYETRKTELQEKLAAAREQLGLLNLKMQALWQQYYAFNSMTPKNGIQKEIAETDLKLKTATAEEAKLKGEIERLAAQSPPGVIK
jgi:hypothetical protein